MAQSQIEVDIDYSAIARTARQSERHALICRAVLSSQRIPHREVTIRDTSEYGLGGRGAMLVPGKISGSLSTSLAILKPSWRGPVAIASAFRSIARSTCCGSTLQTLILP